MGVGVTWVVDEVASNGELGLLLFLLVGFNFTYKASIYGNITLEYFMVMDEVDGAGTLDIMDALS